MLAVQGPQPTRCWPSSGCPTGHDYMCFVDARWRRAAASSVCRSGYTGERGYELRPRWGTRRGAVGRVSPHRRASRPCGLGARDTLRTEMGYPLHGQDISLDVTPRAGRLGWAVGWDKPAFWGRDALLARAPAGPRRLAARPARRRPRASRART